MRATKCTVYTFPVKFLFCTDTSVSMELPNLVPRLRIGDCFEMHPSLRTLSCAVIKSPKLSAQSMALPVRLLQGALVIMVLLRISQILVLQEVNVNAVLVRYHSSRRFWM